MPAAGARLRRLGVLRRGRGAGPGARRGVHGRYYQSVVRHYELDGTHLDNKGYENYKPWSSHVAKNGPEEGARYFTGLHVYGTPRQCRDKIADVHSLIGNDALMAVLSYAGMPPAEAERNLRLFAREVMPEVRNSRREHDGRGGLSEFGGKVALVTGAAGPDLGQAIARRLAAGGARVVVTDRSERRTKLVRADRRGLPRHDRGRLPPRRR